MPGPWLTWFKVASVPALVALLTGPLILYKIFPPESKNTPEAPGIATKRLEVSVSSWEPLERKLLPSRYERTA